MAQARAVLIDNAYIADQLVVAAKAHRNTYGSKALMNSANIIRHFAEPIVDPETQLQGVPGIGKGTIDRIKEIMSQGQLALPPGGVEQEETAEQKAMKDLQRVHGIGPRAAENFVVNYGVQNINDLRNRVEAGEIRLTPVQRIGLQYVEDLEKRIPRAEVKEIGEYVIGVWTDLDPEKNIGEVVGSYRRGKPTSGDVDILITNTPSREGKNVNRLRELIDQLKEAGLITHIFSQGPVKFQGTYVSNSDGEKGSLRTLDIRYVPPEVWPTALLHSTGSDTFNVLLREKAINLEMRLSEHGLFKVGPNETLTLIPVSSEKDVFDILGVQYLRPEERDM